MRTYSQLGSIALAISSLSVSALAKPVASSNAPVERSQLWGNTEFVKRDTNSSTGAIKPKVVIISMFGPEADVWYGIPEFDLFAVNITLPGLSPLFPAVHCTADGDVCQVTLGESGKFKLKFTKCRLFKS
jgi:purine nucleoside permease